MMPTLRRMENLRLVWPTCNHVAITAVLASRIRSGLHSPSYCHNIDLLLIPGSLDINTRPASAVFLIYHPSNANSAWCAVGTALTSRGSAGPFPPTSPPARPHPRNNPEVTVHSARESRRSRSCCRQRRAIGVQVRIRRPWT